MSVAADIQKALSPITSAIGLAQQVGEFLQPIMPGLMKSMFEVAQAVEKGIGTLLDLDLSHPLAMPLSSDMPKPSTPISGLMIGDVRVWVPLQGGSESVLKELELAQHPVEDRTRITDHTWRGPFVFTISGAFVDDPRFSNKHRQALDRLHFYQEQAELVPLFIDFKGVVGDCIVRQVEATRSDFQNTYHVSITVEQVHLVRDPAGDIRNVSQRDPSTGMGVEGQPDNLGVTDPDKWGLPQGAGKPGDGGIGGFFSSMLNTLKNIGDSALGKMALNAVKDLAGKTPLGQLGLAAFDVLTGNQTSTLTKAVNVGLNLLQGKANVADLASVALDFVPGASTMVNSVLGPARQALGFVESLPGGQALLGAALGGANPQQVAIQFAGQMVQQVGGQTSGLQGISSVVGGWLGAP